LTNYGVVLEFYLFGVIISISISSFYRILIFCKVGLYILVEKSLLKAGITAFQIRHLNKSQPAGII